MTTLKGNIKYSIDNLNDVRGAEFTGEHNDCFVRALKHAAGVPYSDAHAYVAKKFNRVSASGTRNPQKELYSIEQGKGTIFGYRAFNRSPQPSGYTTRRTAWRVTHRPKYPTFTQAIKAMRKGRFIVCSHSHAWAVVDGIVHDATTNNRAQVVIIYELKPSSQCESEGI